MLARDLAEQVVYCYDGSNGRKLSKDEDKYQPESLCIEIEEVILKAQRLMMEKVRPGIYKNNAGGVFKVLGMGYESHQGSDWAFRMIVTQWPSSCSGLLVIYHYKEFVQLLDESKLIYVGPE